MEYDSKELYKDFKFRGTAVLQRTAVGTDYFRRPRGRRRGG